MSIETDRLIGRMGYVPILSVKRSVSIGTMIDVDGDRDGHGDGDGTCKQPLRPAYVVCEKVIFSVVSVCSQGVGHPIVRLQTCSLGETPPDLLTSWRLAFD